MAKHYIDIVIVVCLGFIAFSSALDCFTCSNATTVSECKTTQTCNSGEICFAEHSMLSNGVLYSFGCREETVCGAVNATKTPLSANLIGRSASTASCTECCKEPHCNRHLCQHTFSDKECSDSVEVNCVTLENLVNICSDTQRARTICRRFCGLCYYTDGMWSGWSSWSSCDISCGYGTQTRTRTCSNPTPSPDGLPCNGSQLESQTCSLQKCPVHGGWAQWSTWGSCSATCGIGMQRRDRSCSNPYPDLFGDHCFGDSRDDKLCVDAVCPVTDGGWSLWSSWTTCSQSCDSGMHTRSRNCDNPKPSAGGEFCSGSPYEVSACNIQACPRKLSSFSYSNPAVYHNQESGSFWHRHLRSEIKFSGKLYDESSHYDSTTGVFTCHFPGLYVFVASLSSTHDIDCQIQKNSNPYVNVTYSYPTYKYGDNIISRDGGHFTVTESANAHLLRGDTVQVVCLSSCRISCGPTDYLTEDSLFSGFLVAADP